MGSYAECWLESLYISSIKNNFDESVMQLFRASDKEVCKCAVGELPSLLRRSTHCDPNKKIDVVYYAAPAWRIKDRLELKGYTLETAKRAFIKRIRADIRDCAAQMASPSVEHYPPEGKAEHQYYCENRLRTLKAFDPDEWIAILRNIKESGTGTDDGIPTWAKYHRFEPEETLKDLMLKNPWYGYSGADFYVPLRLALETCAEKDSFICNLTDLVSGGWFKKNEDFVALASEFDGVEHAQRSKTIILTEGSSDAWILSESMRLLFPHLSDYFTFMDFEGAKVEGGASHLARIVKAFTGAGIVNKVIAIFDNDTAAQEAIQSLRSVQLPSHFRVIKLPELRMLRKYPTIGPSGRASMNVNGLAASIELYLGEDVLRHDGKKLPPIQWSAYNPVAGKYQGEVQGKREIHKRFKEKLAGQKNGTNLAQDRNWLGLRTVLLSIFSAFHPYDRKLILAERWLNYKWDD